MKIAYCLLGIYKAGGLERITASKVNYFASVGYDVYLITSSQAGRDFYYSIDPRVKHIDLDVRHDLYEQLPRVRAYIESVKKGHLHRKRLERVLMEIRPDITIVPGYHENKFAYKIKDGSLKIIEHHSAKYWNVYMYSSVLNAIPNPSLKTRLSFHIRMLWGRLMTAKYSWHDRHYDVLVLLTEEDRQGFKWHRHTEVIPNPRPMEFDSTALLDAPIILGVGRLIPSKNFGELISIWGKMAKDYPDWKLQILGGGYKKENLEAQIKELGVESQVELLGDTKKVAPYYLNASISVSTSAYEGFPLFMLESITAGIPLISYACPCGPRDIINDGSNGFVVEMGDQETFVTRLRTLIEDVNLRKQMGHNARETAELYTPERVMERWRSLFASLLESKKES
ncbi:glycosyltransferase family 4 protein [Porphyromonas sp.]